LRKASAKSFLLFGILITQRLLARRFVVERLVATCCLEHDFLGEPAVLAGDDEAIAHVQAQVALALREPRRRHPAGRQTVWRARPGALSHDRGCEMIAARCVPGTATREET